MQDNWYVLILAGGGGTRLWPKSREKSPKQFLHLGRELSLLRSTVERARKLVDWDHIYIITNQEQLKDVQKNVPELKLEQIICEPEKRETAMAMGVGAAVIQSVNPEAVVMNFASDHVVENDKEFVRVMKKSAATAEQSDNLVAVGIAPTYPHTGMGYIKIGKQLLNDDIPLFKVDAFQEKPNLATAQALIATKQYFWNANMYTWKASALSKAMEQHAPNTHAVIQDLAQAIGTAKFVKALKVAYAKAEKISIDYAVSEKATNLVLIPGDFGWNDIGDWSVVQELGKKDAAGTVVLKESTGQLVQHESQNNLVHLDGRLVALVGVEDYIVVDTDEILLIMPRDRAQDVKKIVEQLKAKKLEKFL